jgi:integrase
MKKTDEAFSVPLSDRAAEIIAEARRAARKEPTADSFVFFGVIPKRPLSNMALSMLMRRMFIDVTVHGFRTSFRTWASEVGHVEFELAESCLSHRVGNAVSRGPITGRTSWRGGVWSWSLGRVTSRARATPRS